MSSKKNVLITGATKGIGLRTTRALIEMGFDVFATGRNEAKLKEMENGKWKMKNGTSPSTSGRGLNFLARNELRNSGEGRISGYYVGDLTVGDNYAELYQRAKDALGSVDILINNAGEYVYSPIEETKKADIERLIKLNFEVPYLLSQLAVADMKNNNWGRIINIGSISGAVGEANATLYSATKAALTGLTKALALEVATHNITVNIINPGWVNTELTQNALDSEESETLEMIPQKRFIEPQEVADLALYLISDKAKGLTGQYINLCAGLSLG